VRRKPSNPLYTMIDKLLWYSYNWSSSVVKDTVRCHDNQLLLCLHHATDSIDVKNVDHTNKKR